MKKQVFFSVLMAVAILQNAFAQDKGHLTITQSATATHELYDGAVAKLKAAGVWELGWNFHAIGAGQPAGLFSIGVFPDKASLESRVAKTEEVFKANNVPAPPPSVHEIHNIVRPDWPAEKPANALLIFHDVKGMTPEQYEQVLVELKAANAFGDPAQLFHVCFKTPDGLKVVDIWESPEALQAFAGKLIPVLTKIFGVEPPPPAVFGLYNVVSR